MKKIIPLLLAFTFVFCSCSNDDSDESAVFVKKIIETDADGNSYTTNFTYDGARKNRETVTNNQTKESYYIDYSYVPGVYTNDLIANILESSAEGRPLVLIEFSYNGPFLKTVLRTEFVGNEKIIRKTYYTSRNINESYDYKTVDVDANNNAESNPVLGKLTLEKGQIVKEEISGAENTTIVYEYDENNNPFKNVKGVEELIGNFNLGYSKSNTTKKILNTSLSGNSTINSSTYTYNGKKFPTEAKHFDKEGKLVGSTQYFY